MDKDDDPWEYFRGGDAPASLKLQDGLFLEVLGEYFRGGDAPASLKHHSFILAGRTTALFPGWRRPGLIEAIKVLGSNTLTHHISGVETPRPH